VGQRIVGVGDGEVIAVGRRAEIDHAAAVVADLEEQAGMIAAQFLVDAVIGAHGVVAYVGGVGGHDEIGGPVVDDVHGAAVGRGVGMVVADAAIGNQVAVVLEHVEVVAFDDALEF